MNAGTNHSNYPYTEYNACAVPNFSSHVSNIFIYSNIVDYEVMGNKLTKLLKTVRGSGH